MAGSMESMLLGGFDSSSDDDSGDEALVVVGTLGSAAAAVLASPPKLAPAPALAAPAPPPALPASAPAPKPAPTAPSPAARNPSTVHSSAAVKAMNHHQQQQQQQQHKPPAASDRALLEREAKQRKEKFLMFTRVLMKYLEQKDPTMHSRAKAVIKECAERNKAGDAAYASLTNSMQKRLRQTVGEMYWKKAEDYLNHFLKQKLKHQAAKQQAEAAQRQATAAQQVQIDVHATENTTISKQRKRSRATSIAMSEPISKRRKRIGTESTTTSELTCVLDHWMSSTRMLHHLKVFEYLLQASPALLKACKADQSCKNIIKALAQHSGHNRASSALRLLWDVGDTTERRHPNVILAYLLLIKYTTENDCWALIETLGDRVPRCASAQKQAYNLLVLHGAHAYERRGSVGAKTEWDELFSETCQIHQPEQSIPVVSPADSDITALQDEHLRSSCKCALNKIHFMVEDYLDGHKENALNSSLHEPARFYFHLCGNYHYRDNVNVHGINGWLCLVRGWFGCQMPMIPLGSDVHTFMGCADVWSGLSEDTWDIFRREDNFGRDFEGIKGLNGNCLKNSQYGTYSGGHSFVGRNAEDMEKAARRKDSKYQQYANKFAYFFSKQFLVKRMFEILNAESKPEYYGFRNACKDLFPIFKVSIGINDDSLDVFLYDEDLMHLDVDKAALFFWWCGVCKETESIRAAINEESKASRTTISEDSNDENDENTCPICFEEKDNIVPIPHWEAKGDISSHRMCKDCMEKYKKNECPFCHEVSLKESLLSLISKFVHEVKTKSMEGDPNQLAALTESWQFMEMEHGSNPRVLHRIAKLVLLDAEFSTLLHHCVRTKGAWMRDAAGLIFRLYGMMLEGDLAVAESEQRLLTRCYNTIIETLRNNPVMSGHFLGAIYSQAMVPFICALQHGQKTARLGSIVKEIGQVIVELYDRRKGHHPNLRQEVRERIINEYMPIVTTNVWKTQESDPVWLAFYSKGTGKGTERRLRGAT